LKRNWLANTTPLQEVAGTRDVAMTGVVALDAALADAEQAESEGRELGDWTPTCPDRGGPLRYLPKRLEITRADDTS
jgi:hypothetical protein